MEDINNEEETVKLATTARILADLIERVDSYAVNLALSSAKTSITVAGLSDRVSYLESRSNSDRPLSFLLRDIDSTLSERERDIDDKVWCFLENQRALKLPGGFYDLDCLLADTCGCDSLSLEDAVSTSLRWCASRTRWFTNVRYWVRPIESVGTLVIQRNRFVFQVKNPPEKVMFLD